MKNKENRYVIAFDASKNFKEIRVMADSNEPFSVDPDMTGGSIYVFTHKEFKKLIESSMLHLTEPVGENTDTTAIDQQAPLPHAVSRDPLFNSTTGYSPLHVTLQGAVSAGSPLDNGSPCYAKNKDGKVYYMGSICSDNGKQ